MQAPPFQTPLGLGQLLDRVFRLYRLRFGKLVLTAAIFFVPMGVLAALLLGVAMSSYFDLIFNAIDGPSLNEDAVLFASGATIGLSLLVAGIALILGALAVSGDAGASRRQRQRQRTVGTRQRARRSQPLLGLCRAVAAGGADHRRRDDRHLLWRDRRGAGLCRSARRPFDTGRGQRLCGRGRVPADHGADPGGHLCDAAAACLSDDALVRGAGGDLNRALRPGGGAERSWHLTAGSFWRLFGLLILMVVLNSVVLSLPLSLLQFFAVILLTSQMLGAVNGVLTGFSYFVSILWYPFWR
jgi:hypothetical protein